MEHSQLESFPRPGEWPCYRANGKLDARAKGTGAITTPRMAWKQFVGRRATLFAVEPGDRESTLALPEHDVAPGLDVTADARWGLLPPLRELQGRRQPVRIDTTVTYADVFPAAPGLEKLEFESGFNKPMVNGQWQSVVGRCFRWQGDRWEEAWQTESVPLMFIPLPIAGDFDADGQLEVAILPWYELVILDARTGKVKDRCRFAEGRSYGFFGVYDLDGDGKSEFVVQSDFAKHVDVLGYRNGRLSLLWQRPIELGFDDPQKILRVKPDPVADVDGDGRLEVLINLYNGANDGRWHMTVHDGITGAVKADFPDEHLDGVSDLDGDGSAELLTTGTSGGGIPTFSTIRVRSLKHAAVLWQREGAGWQFWEPPLPPHVNSSATLGRRDVLHRRVGKHVAVVIRQPVGQADSLPSGPLGQANRPPHRETDVVLSLEAWTEGGFRPGTRALGPGLEAVALDGDGTLLVRGTTRPGAAATVRVTAGQARVVQSRPEGVPAGTAVVAMPRDEGRGARVKSPGSIVFAQGAGEEIVAFRPPRGEEPGGELWRRAGRGQSGNWPAQTMGPVVADLRGDGGRQLLYANASPTGCGRLVAWDLSGHEVWHHDFPAIPGTPPVWNTGGVILWQAGHFTDRRRQDVLVTVRRSVMHSDETALLSGRDGRELWRRAHQINGRGVGGTPFAVADYDGDGLEELASLYPSEFYVMHGTTGRDVLAMAASWEGVPVKPVYWGQPIAGDFEGTGKNTLFFATQNASLTAVIRPDGSMAWWDALEQSPKSLPAIGDFDGDGRLEAIGIGYPDGIRCYDTATGKVRWRAPLPAPGNPAGSASGDINGDGRDEALFVIGKTLYCLGAPKGEPGKGRLTGASGQAAQPAPLLWQLELPSNVGPPTIADADGDGKLEILLVGADGYVYGVR